MKVRIDPERCIGRGACEELGPDVCPRDTIVTDEE